MIFQPKERKQTEAVSFRIETETLESFRQLIGNQGVTVSEAIRQLIERTIESVES